MSRFDSKIGVRRDELGNLLNDIELRLAPLEEGIRAEDGTGTDIPTVDTSFVPVYDRTDSKWVYVTLRFNIPGNTYDLNIVMVERATIVDEASYDQKRLKGGLANGIEDKHRSAVPPTVTDRVDIKLKYSTVYDIIRLVAKDNDGGSVANPQNTNYLPIPVTEPLGYPGNVLFSFTTPERFGVPLFPVLADIDTQLDFETEGYDAYAIIQNTAPLHPETGVPQTYRAGGVDWVQNVIERTYPAPTGNVETPERLFLSDPELDDFYPIGDPTIPDRDLRGRCKVKFVKLVPGGEYRLIRSTVHTVDGKRTSTGSVTFIAGGLVRSLAGLTNLALVATNTDPFDGGDWVDIALEFTQPWPGPNSLRHITQKYKRSTVTDWKILGEPKNELVQNDIYHVQVNAGLISIGAGSTTLTGSGGTQFTRWEAGWKIKVGVQTFVLADKPTSDTVATITVAAGSPVVSSPYTVVFVIPIHRIKTKPNRTYNNSLRIVGRGGTSLTLTVDVTLGEDGHVINDTDVPSGLNAPGIDWTPAGRLRIRGLQASTDVQTLKEKYIVISDGTSGAGTAYLEILSRSLITGIAVEGTARFPIGLKAHLTLVDIKKKIFKNVFGSTGNFSVYWYAENNFGVSLKSANSNVLNVATMGSDIIADGSNGVGQIDVGAGMNTKTQILENGDLHFEQSATVLAHWRRRESPFTSDGPITITDTENIWWDRDDDVVVWENNASRLYAPLKRWIKGRETITITFMARTPGFLFNPLVNIRVRLGDNTDVSVAPVTCTLTGLDGTFKMFGGTLTIIDNPGTTNRFLSFETAHVLTDANSIIMDKFMLVRGREPAAYAPRPEYETGVDAGGNPDTIPTATPASIPDTGIASGIEGGYTPTGGLFTFPQA